MVKDEKGMIMKLFSAIVLFAVLSGRLTGVLAAYPPDNAAVLYHRAFLLTEEPSDEVDTMLGQLRKGEIEVNNKIREYIDKHREVIRYAMDASDIEFCDWGLDMSEGFNLRTPELAKMRQLSYLLLADTSIHTADGDTMGALNRCLAIHGIGRHVGEQVLIFYLVGVTMNQVANEAIINVLSSRAVDTETLTWLKRKLMQISTKSVSIKSALANETQMSAREFCKERMDMMITGGIIVAYAEKLREADDEFFAGSRDYYLEFAAKSQKAMDLPYAEAIGRLNKLNLDVVRDTSKNDKALLTAMLKPAITSLFSKEANKQSSFNSLIAAIEVYIIKAKTGSLPDKLPAGLPKDMFSGEDFEYEITADGFILRCRAKDLVKDEVYQHEFEIKQ